MPSKNRTKQQDACRKRQEYARRKTEIAARRKEIRDAWTMPQTLKSRITTARNNAKKNGIECSLTVDQLMDIYDDQGGRCAISGRVLSPKGSDENVVSIDRIVAGGPYSMDNVQLVVKKINSLKGQLTNDELVHYATQILKTHAPQLLASPK